MNASVAMANGADADPAEALQRAKEAKRIYSAGHWHSLMIVLGTAEILVGVYTALLPNIHWNLSSSSKVAIAVALYIVFVGGGLLMRQRFIRARQRAIARGEPHLAKPNLPRGTVIGGIAFGVAVVAAAASLTWLGYTEDIEDKAWPMTAILLGITTVMCWHGWRLRLWEYGVAATGSLAAAALCLLHDLAGLGDEVLPLMTVVFGVPFLIAGIFLRRRWRAFVAALPKEDAA